MAPRISTALSKTAAERRRDHQIPRKRPTSLPLPRYPPPRIRKPAARHDKNEDREPLGQIQQTRGENRTSVPDSNGNDWAVRRILASRRNGNVLEYKVQWETSWEDASTIKGRAVEKWKEALDDGGTFEFVARDRSKWTVLRDENSGENDHEDMQWDMWVAIHRNVVEEVKQDWLGRMVEVDFEYGSADVEKKVAYVAARYGLPIPTSALAALQTAWEDLSRNPRLEDEEILYGDARVRYLDRLDPLIDDEDDSSSRAAISISSIVRLLHSDPLARLDLRSFTHDHGTYAAFAHWRSVLISLIHTTPFMFKAGTWMQLFALLLLGGDLLITELEKVGISVQEDWAMRVREYDMHLYYEQIVDNRAPHEIQETYLCLREFFRDLKPDDVQDVGTVVKELGASTSCVPPRDTGNGAKTDRAFLLNLCNDDHQVEQCRIRHLMCVTPSPEPVTFRDLRQPAFEDSNNSSECIPASTPSSKPRPPLVRGERLHSKVMPVDPKETIEKEKQKLFERMAELHQLEKSAGDSDLHHYSNGSNSRQRSFGPSR